jgi:hypothetical protein
MTTNADDMGLGAPPRSMSPEYKRAWRLFCEELPWLTKADRALVAFASTQRAYFEGGRGEPAQQEIYLAVLAKLGATPVDRPSHADR